MAPEIRPTRPDDLPELSRFLTAGFAAPADAPFAAPDVLRWKYFDPRGAGPEPRSFVANDEAEIVGHLGLCTGSFVGDAVDSGEVATLHMIDWLSARKGEAIGAKLMLRAHRGFPTGYGLGGSTAGRSVGGGGGYGLVTTVPVYRRILRVGQPLARGGPGRWARDLARAALGKRRLPRAPVTLQPVRRFGPEVDEVLARYRARTVFTNRRPELLNHILGYPRGGVTGWLVARDGQVRGFGLLSVVLQGKTRVGKLVDCVLDDPDPDRDPDPDLWHASIDAMTQALAGQGADIAEGFASTPWMAAALRQSGFRPAHDLEFRLRDKQGRIPPGAVFHLTPLEADYAYT
jgi:hypothetical protein